MASPDPLLVRFDLRLDDRALRAAGATDNDALCLALEEGVAPGSARLYHGGRFRDEHPELDLCWVGVYPLIAEAQREALLRGLRTLYLGACYASGVQIVGIDPLAAAAHQSIVSV